MAGARSPSDPPAHRPAPGPAGTPSRSARQPEYASIGWTSRTRAIRAWSSLGPGNSTMTRSPSSTVDGVRLRDRDAASHVQGGLEFVQLHQCPLQVASCCSVVGAVDDRSAQRGNTVFPQSRCPVLEQGPTIQGQHGPRGWGCRGGNDLSGGAHRRMTSLLRGRQGYGVWVAAVSPRCPGTGNRATPAAGHVRLPSVAGVRKLRQSTDTAAGPPSRVTHRLARSRQSGTSALLPVPGNSQCLRLAGPGPRRPALGGASWR